HGGFGVSGCDLREGRYTPAFVELMTFEAARARDYYARAWRGLPATDRRTLFAAEIMGHTYFALLRAIEARRFDVFGARVAVPTLRRVAIALSGSGPRAGVRPWPPPGAPRPPLARARRRPSRCGPPGLPHASRGRREGLRRAVSARMRGQVFHGPGDLRLAELPRPAPRPGARGV